MAAIYRQAFGEFLLIIATWAAIVAALIEQGVAIGIVLSLLHGIWSVTRAHAIVFERVPGTFIWWPPIPHRRAETLPNIVVLAFQAPLSFLNAYHFRRDVLAALRNAPEPVRLVFWKRARLRGEAQALEPLHLPLPSSGRLMRILRSIVTPSTAFMADCDSKITGCSSI